MIHTPVFGLVLLALFTLPAWPAETSREISSEGASQPSPSSSWVEKAGLGGHARFDYYSASKRLDDNHSLPGLTLQPKALPKFGSWGDAKIEGRIQDEDLSDSREIQGRLLEAYANLYSGALDVRIGKQNIPWGRADALNPTDNLTPKDFTLLSARDEEERRTGTAAVKANYYRNSYTLSLIWLPLFNPSTIPLALPPGTTLTEDKRADGDWNDQGFAIKLDQVGGVFDWSLSYYNGLDLLPVPQPISQQHIVLLHNRLQVFGADFARPLGRYGVRGELAYVHTEDAKGVDAVIKNSNLFYVLGADRNLTEDVNINFQFYQRIIINFHDPFDVQDPLLRNITVLNAVVNQQQDRWQEGITGRIRATWWNKTLETELLGVWNANRSDFFLRPLLVYAFSDVWKGFAGADIFNGPTDSFFGRLRPATALFVEVRATY